MQTFLKAHGYDPGPLQRPVLAGAATGLAASLPACAILAATGSLAVEAKLLGMTMPATIATGTAAMMLAGAAYGKLFRRSANDRRGGWLIGMAFGFLIWSGGAMMVFGITSGGFVPGGLAAIGILLALLAWGTALGASFPTIHASLNIRMTDSRIARLDRLGPDAIIPRDRPERAPEQRRGSGA
jgi:hypothetical protein